MLIGRAVFKLLVGKNIFAIDDHAVFFAQLGFDFGQRLIKARVQLFGGVEHGGVGQFEFFSHTGTPLVS